MIELAHHILDIGENSTRAGASEITIAIRQDDDRGLLILQITDNGKGMTEEEKKRALDPFFTTKKVRDVGLGLPMFAHAAERTGGTFSLDSTPGKGTQVTASFGLRHIDRQPLGDVGGAVATLIMENPEIRIIYRHSRDGEEFVMDTEEVKRELGDVPINHAEVLKFIREFINSHVKELSPEA